MKKILYILLTVNILLSQTEYQILSLPHNSFELSTNNGFYNLNAIYAERYNHNSSFSFSSLLFPADIVLYNSQINHLSLSILDYGQFENKMDDIVINTFHAYEIFLTYNQYKDIKTLGTFGLSLGGIYSHIHHYNSAAIIGSIGLKHEFNKLEVGVSIENFGIIVKHYTDYDNQLPLKYRLSLLYTFQDIKTCYDVVYIKNYKDFEHIFSISLPVLDNIELNIANTSYSNTLSIDNYDLNILSGLSFGANINLEKLNLDLGVKNLGSAGLIFGITINFLLI